MSWAIKAMAPSNKTRGMELHGDDQIAFYQQFVDETLLMFAPIVGEAHASK